MENLVLEYSSIQVDELKTLVDLHFAMSVSKIAGI